MILRSDISSYKAVFFDLDGTLIDSAKDLNFAIELMADELQLEKPGLQNVKHWIGDGTLKLVEQALFHMKKGQPSQFEVKQAFELFSSAYKECLGEHSTLYPDTQKLLVKLLSHKIKIACITNKPIEFTDFLLMQNMIRQFFSVICAGDTVKHQKPDAWPLLHVSNTLKVDISECLMIGDSVNDVEAARNAGCDVIAVNYGYNKGIDIKKSNPDLVIASFDELL